MFENKGFFMTFPVDMSQASAFFHKIIEEQASEKELAWTNQQEKKLRNNFQLRSFYLTFSTASRFIGKNNLNFTQDQLGKAEELRKGFQPQYWNLLQCVRTFLLLMLPNEDAESYEANITKLFETADIDEQVTLYSALPLLPYPEIMVNRAAEGVRTNVTDVFDATALNNPYPADFLDQRAWNQMILKAVFMQRPLYRIYEADERANPELARMLVDFAHERWSANRKVLPELWRFVGPFMNKNYLGDIEKVIEGEPLERQAGLLACVDSDLREAHQLLERFPDVNKEIEGNVLNWAIIGKKSEDVLLN